MTLQAKWYLEQQEDGVVVCTLAPGSVTTVTLGVVQKISAGYSKGTAVLKVCFNCYYIYSEFCSNM